MRLSAQLLFWAMGSKLGSTYVHAHYTPTAVEPPADNKARFLVQGTRRCAGCDVTHKADSRCASTKSVYSKQWPKGTGSGVLRDSLGQGSSGQFHIPANECHGCHLASGES